MGEEYIGSLYIRFASLKLFQNNKFKNICDAGQRLANFSVKHHIVKTLDMWTIHDLWGNGSTLLPKTTCKLTRKDLTFGHWNLYSNKTLFMDLQELDFPIISIYHKILFFS